MARPLGRKTKLGMWLWRYWDEVLLLTATDNQNFRVNSVDSFGPLAFPARNTSHVSIWCGLFREILEAFGNSMHGVYSPAIFG